MTRVCDHVEPVTLHPVAPSALTTAERAAFIASLRSAECPACEVVPDPPGEVVQLVPVRFDAGARE